MDRFRKASLALVVILLGACILTVIYYNYTIGNKDSEIDLLGSQVSKQSKEIENLKSQIINLEAEVENLSSQIENMKVIQAEITFIAEDINFYPMVGTAVSIPFDVHITNMGSIDIQNSTLALENIGTNTVARGTYTSTRIIDIIQAKQTFETSADNKIKFYLLVDLTKVEEARSLDYSVTISLNDTLLDEKIYYHNPK